jgi:hypothetical protein
MLVDVGDSKANKSMTKMGPSKISDLLLAMLMSILETMTKTDNGRNIAAQTYTSIQSFTWGKKGATK